MPAYPRASAAAIRRVMSEVAANHTLTFEDLKAKKRGPLWDNARAQAILAARDTLGASFHMIGAAIDRNPSSVVTAYHRELERASRIKTAAEQQAELDERDAKILELFRQGMTKTDIAQRFGLSQNWVRQVIKRHAA